VHPDSEVVALVGAPNSGKTTLYNWLTNSKFKTVNYPGATVEYSIGNLAAHFLTPGESADLRIMDTPGTYSLFPKSIDEEVTLKALYEPPGLAQPLAKVIVVVDATQMARHLLLAKQIKEAGFSMVIALTMVDLLRKNKLHYELSVLEKEFECPVVPIEGLLGGGVDKLVHALMMIPKGTPQKLPTWSDSILAAKTQRAEFLAHETLGAPKSSQVRKIYQRTAQIDRILLHPIFGIVLFAGLMFFLFSSVFWIAAPFMEATDAAFTWFGSLVLKILPTDNLFSDFLSQGIIASFAAVMVFVPQIFILFLGIGIFEGSGYLARAATLIDRPFSKLGMSGRSFVPVLSGFACAVPAMMATRNISSSRDRWITNFIIPLMTCSARLPVYALLLSFLFQKQPAWKAGLALAVIYFASLLMGAAAAAVLNKILAKSRPGFFVMELPLYRRPVMRTLISAAYHRTKAYVRRAGPPIFIFSVIVWVGTTFPHVAEKNQAVRLQSSYMSEVGHVIEPVFTPMGGDWRTGVGLISAFAARETFVSALALLMNVTTEDAAAGQNGDQAQASSLLAAMSAAKNSTGETLFTLSSTIGLIIFFMLAMQCLATFSIAVKEMGSMKFAISQLIVYNILAYVISVTTVQVMRHFGIA
jgi:ferrous iron transport protein B